MLQKSFLSLAVIGCLVLSGVGLCHEHEHEHAGDEPHRASRGGALVGLEYDGDEVAHLEMTSDPALGEARIYLTNETASESAPIPQESIEVLIVPASGDKFTLIFEAAPDESKGETPGDSSVFAVKDPRLAGMENYAVRITSIFIQGFEVNDVSFRYPEGNH